VVELVNINRINLVFIPIIFCAAAFLDWLWKQRKILLVTLVGIYAVNFIAFTVAYHGEEYRTAAGRAFFSGLLPALDHARQLGDQPVCVTDQVNMPYIYVLFTEKPNPASYLDTIQYVDPRQEFREVSKLGRYSFGIENCPNDPRTIYVLSNESLPDNGIKYSETDFSDYHVFLPIGP
jgi:hypothetical protein